MTGQAPHAGLLRQAQEMLWFILFIQAFLPKADKLRGMLLDDALVFGQYFC
jgi:hypothetical protein